MRSATSMSCSIRINVIDGSSCKSSSVSATRSPRESPDAGSRREVAGDDVDQRRLAGAVRAENRTPLAVRDVEIDVAHGVEAAEPPADPPQAEDRLGVLGYCSLGHLATNR